MPRDPDLDLLARLNSLKKSPLGFVQQPTPSGSPPGTPRRGTEDTVETDLAARFRKLAGKSGIADHGGPNGFSTLGLPNVETGNDEYKEDDQTLEELLRAVQSDDDWHLNPEDPENIKTLLDESQEALKSERQTQRSDGLDAVAKQPTDIGSISNNSGSSDVSTDSKQAESFLDWTAIREKDLERGKRGQKKEDDQEAEDYISKVLAELELDAVYGTKEDNASPDQQAPETSEESTGANPTRTVVEDGPTTSSQPTAFNLPNTPTKLLPLTQPSPAAPLFALPATPTAAPTRKPPVSVFMNTSLRKHTDEEISSWCCICLDDATLQCLGCAEEGAENHEDLYCERCWREGHTGEDAGLEQRRHRAVTLAKGGGVSGRKEKHRVAVRTG